MALNIGNVYFHVSQPPDRRGNLSPVQYPEVVLNPQNAGNLPVALQNFADQIRAVPNEWPAPPARNPAQNIGEFIRAWRTEDVQGQYQYTANGQGLNFFVIRRFR